LIAFNLINRPLIKKVRLKMEEKQEYKKPELVQHENLNKITAGTTPSSITTPPNISG
jgi:hypothetical protein